MRSATEFLWQLASRQKIARTDIQSCGEPVEIQNCHISLTPFDSTNVVAMESTAMCEFFLRPSPLLTESTQDSSYGRSDVLCRSHTFNHTYKCLMYLHTMSVI